MHTDDYFELLRNQPAMTEQEVRAIVDAYPSDETTIQPTAQALGWLWVLLLFPLLIWPAAHNLLKDSETATTIQSNHPMVTTTIPALSDTVVVAPSIPLPPIGDSIKKRTVAITPHTSPSFPDSLTISAPFSPVGRGDSGAFHYGFPVGRRLVYRKIDDYVDTAFQESTLFTTEASIEVQERDTAGNYQLVLTTINEQQTDRQKPVQSFSIMSFAADILSLHTTVSPQGEYLDGKVIKNSKERKEMRQRAKQPNFQGHVATDEIMLRSMVESWLTVLPKRVGFTVGDAWSDTLNSSQTMRPIGVKDEKPTAITITSQTISKYTVGSDTLINNTPCIQLHIEAVKQDVLPGRSATFVTTKQIFFRKRDRVVVREIGQHILRSNQQPGAWTKITKELIQENPIPSNQNMIDMKLVPMIKESSSTIGASDNQTIATAPSNTSTENTAAFSAAFTAVDSSNPSPFHYGFPVGRRLVYRKISDAVDTGSGQSDLFTVEAALEVQGYDSSGNAQVLITILNERLTDRKQSPEISLSDPSPTSIVVRPQIMYQTSIPILQAVFTPQGKYVSGIAVKYSAEHERSLQPPANTKNVMVIRASPESIIRHEAEKWFQELLSFITLTPGRNWVDTVFEPHNVVSMNVPSRETKQNEVGYRIISTYTVLSDTLINSIPCTHLLINAVKREEGTTWNSQFFSTHHLFLRKTDTVLMRQESEYTSNGGGVQPGAWTKITKELIAEE